MIAVAVVFCLALSPASLIARANLARQEQSIKEARSEGVRQAVSAFEQRVKDYVKMRERLEEKLPKLSKESTPEQIEAHKVTFQETVRTARAGVKAGDVFTPDIVDHIRRTIKEEFKGKRLRELRETLLDVETKGVPIRVNYPYPEAKELTQIPPTLLLILPQLSKQMRYRFVGRHMLLVDRENHLIVDYALNVLP
jgi:hypothetical protein